MKIKNIDTKERDCVVGIREIVKKSFLEGYAASALEIEDIFICILCTAVIAVYIYLVYKNVNKNSFYNRSFNLSLLAIAIITSAIILTIQSNIVVSLGMVGALSIVRFRTAIKDPMDLAFLFWSISVGIICGAGFAMVAVITSVVLTIVIVLFSMLPEARRPLILVVNGSSYQEEDKIMQAVEECCQYAKTRARNVSKTSLNLAIEIRVTDQKGLIERLMKLEGVTTASLVEHDGEVTV